VLVARGAHADAINRDGLRVTGIEERTYRVRAATSIDALPPDALIVLTTKVSDTYTACAGVRHLLRADSTILCVQNGLYSEDLAKSAVGDRSVVLRAITALRPPFSARRAWSS